MITRESLDAQFERAQASFEQSRENPPESPATEGHKLADTETENFRIAFIGSQWVVTPWGYIDPISVHDTLDEARAGLREAESAVAA